jgi:yersiniabactin salicyl-AMP ligase
MSQQHNSWPLIDQKKYTHAGCWETNSLGKLLTVWSETFNDNIAVIDKDIQLSYKELEEKANQFAAGLVDLDIQDGDRVLIQLPNCYEFLVASFALFKIGALPIFSMPAQRENDIGALCQLSEAKAYIIPDRFLGFNYLPMAQHIQQQVKSLEHVIVVGEPANYIAFNNLFKTRKTLTNPKATDTALLLLSGGTTGTPKLIPRTHADYIFNAKKAAEVCGFSESTIYLATLPIGHNFPLCCPGIFGTFSLGGTVVMAKTPGSDETFGLIEKHRVTVTALVPPIVQLWLTAREWDTTDISSLTLLQVGGAKFEKKLAEQVTPKLGCKLQQVFGMAEGLLCYTRLEDSKEIVLNTQGRPLCSHDEIRIVNKDGDPVMEGEVGELHTKGPYTIRGYFRAEEYNTHAFTKDGFYKTGDLVKLRTDGNLIVEGRIKEQINRAGEKIAVAEVENALNTHSQIEKAILVPVPDEHLGERSCAFVITNNSNLKLQDTHELLNDLGMARYKLPDQLEQMTVWPLTAVGKIDKKKLIARAIASYDSIKTRAVFDKQQYLEATVEITSLPNELAMKLASTDIATDYAIYEHIGEWSIGLDRFADIFANKKKAWLSIKDQIIEFNHPRLCDAIQDATRAIPVDNWRIYGTAKFEMSHVFHGIDIANTQTREDEILHLFVPSSEVRITEGKARIRVLNSAQLEPLIKLVTELDEISETQNISTDKTAIPIKVDVENINKSAYQQSVQNAVDEINNHYYQKVILSRRVPLPTDIDLLESYRLGRANNTPARSFLLKISDKKLAGFSPETVVEVAKDGWISTQPLAGTRSLGENKEQELKLKKELLSDTKEIAEHAVSVKLAQEELVPICDPESIVVSEFMAVRRRGSVQHLASRVKGKLKKDKTAWDAFESLFPAVTASGIPKKAAIEAIHRHEPETRGWYSGCVMIVDSDGSMDAALVLRSIYQDGEKIWLQAGAGIVDQSTPERELEETTEKLSCVSKYLVKKTTCHSLLRQSINEEFKENYSEVDNA